MTVQQVLQELRSLSDEKVYERNLLHGANEDNQFGLKMGDVRKVANKIKRNHELGLELWQTGIIEARLVAILILNPKRLSAPVLNEMVKSIDFAYIADWFNSYLLKNHPDRDQLMEEWLHADNIWAARSGWSLLAGKIAKGAEGHDLNEILDRIEREMPGAEPEVQWTMNTALAYIGIHHPELRQRAIDIGNRLEIFKDYPTSKGCTSPFAPIWINEMVRRQEQPL